MWTCGGREFQIEEVANAKALRWECAQESIEASRAGAKVRENSNLRPQRNECLWLLRSSHDTCTSPPVESSA